MSEQDKKILSDLKISGAELGRAIGVTRTAIHQGVNSNHHYIKSAVLVRALSHWRESNPPLYIMALKLAKQLYPEYPFAEPLTILQRVEMLRQETGALSHDEVQRRALLVYEGIVRGELTLRTKAGDEVLLLESMLTPQFPWQLAGRQALDKAKP